MSGYKKLLVLAIGIIGLAACDRLTPGLSPTEPSDTTQSPSSQAPIEISEFQVPDDWQRVSDPVFGIAFAYPQDWNVRLAESITSEVSLTPSVDEGEFSITRFDADHSQHQYTPPPDSAVLEQQQITIGGHSATWRRVQGTPETISIEIPVNGFTYHLSADLANSEHETVWNQFLSSISFIPGLDLIQPTVGQQVQSPLVVTGSIPGTWYFEASFPARIVDSNNQTLGTGIMQAQGEWMTEEAVEFSGEIRFTAPANQANGFLILEKDNPSGLPENARSVSIPIQF